MKKIQAAKVTKIKISNIEPNPHNPRRLFDEEPMHILKESIEKLGILVPITVYPKDYNKTNPLVDKFVILDGERRWRSVIEINQTTAKMKQIPAIIVERPSDAENILIMFHIHNLREGWQLMPTALKLEVLMHQFHEKNEKKLSVLTKLSISQIRRCKTLLSYSKKHQNMMLAPLDKRLKTDFFIELDRIRKPALSEKFPPWQKYGDVKCVDIFLGKYLNGKIKAVTDFRKLAETYRGALRLRKTNQFYEALEDFLKDENSSIETVYVKGADFEKETKETARSAGRIYTQLKNLNNDALASSADLVELLKKLMKLIKSKLEDSMLIKGSGDDL